MASNVFSTRFLEAVGASSDLTYPVPAGFVMVLRCIDVYANVTGDSSIYFHGALGQTIWTVHWPPLSASHAQWTGRQVFVAGELFVAHLSVAPLDGVDLTASGYLLTAP